MTATETMGYNPQIELYITSLLTLIIWIVVAWRARLYLNGGGYYPDKLFVGSLPVVITIGMTLLVWVGRLRISPWILIYLTHVTLVGLGLMAYHILAYYAKHMPTESDMWEEEDSEKCH